MIFILAEWFFQRLTKIHSFKNWPAFSSFGCCFISYTQFCEIPNFLGQIGIDKILCPLGNCSCPETWERQQVFFSEKYLIKKTTKKENPPNKPEVSEHFLVKFKEKGPAPWNNYNESNPCKNNTLYVHALCLSVASSLQVPNFSRWFLWHWDTSKDTFSKVTALAQHTELPRSAAGCWSFWEQVKSNGGLNQVPTSHQHPAGLFFLVMFPHFM